jgi:hypothetical protein
MVGQVKHDEPSVISSTSPLSPKHLYVSCQLEISCMASSGLDGATSGSGQCFPQRHVWVDSDAVSVNDELVGEDVDREGPQERDRTGTRKDSLGELPCRRLLRVSVDHDFCLYWSE